MIGLFCRIWSLLLVSFAKETSKFQEPTSHSHPIVTLLRSSRTHQSGFCCHFTNLVCDHNINLVRVTVACKSSLQYDTSRTRFLQPERDIFLVSKKPLRHRQCCCCCCLRIFSSVLFANLFDLFELVSEPFFQKRDMLARSNLAVETDWPDSQSLIAGGSVHN